MPRFCTTLCGASIFGAELFEVFAAAISGSELLTAGSEVFAAGSTTSASGSGCITTLPVKGEGLVVSGAASSVTGSVPDASPEVFAATIVISAQSRASAAVTTSVYAPGTSAAVSTANTAFPSSSVVSRAISFSSRSKDTSLLTAKAIVPESVTQAVTCKGCPCSTVRFPTAMRKETGTSSSTGCTPKAAPVIAFPLTKLRKKDEKNPPVASVVPENIPD